MEERVRRAGLGGALGIEWRDEGGGAGGLLVERLHDAMRRQVRATWNLTRIGAALTWWEEFKEVTGRVAFKPLVHAGDLSASVYNNVTLDLFAMYIRERGSRKAGQVGATLSSDYISATVATIKLLRSGQAHYDVAPAEANTARSTAYMLQGHAA